MSVLFETTLGDIVIDLYYKECPLACKNFLKLSKIKYYNNSLFHEIQSNYIAVCGIPVNKNLPYCKKENEFDFISKLDNKFEDSESFNKINTKLNNFNSLKEATSIYGILGQNKYFKNEFHLKLKHNKKGLVSTANLGSNLNNSLFFITLTDNHIIQFDNKHSIFGIVAEGIEVLDKLNKVICDNVSNKPLQNVRILKAIVLDDPFSDDEILHLIPNNSPLIIKDVEYDLINMLSKENDENVDNNKGLKNLIKINELRSKEIALNLLENNINTNKISNSNTIHIDDANTIFVGNLNPMTHEEGLIDIFSKLGNVIDCEIIRDKNSKISKGFGFIKFKSQSSCEQAVLKMNNAIIDDRKIKVDFSFRKNINKISNSEKNTNSINIDNKYDVYTNQNNNKYDKVGKIISEQCNEKKDFNKYDNNHIQYKSNENLDYKIHKEKYKNQYEISKIDMLKSSLISKKREKDYKE